MSLNDINELSQTLSDPGNIRGVFKDDTFRMIKTPPLGLQKYPDFRVPTDFLKMDHIFSSHSVFANWHLRTPELKDRIAHISKDHLALKSRS